MVGELGFETTRKSDRIWNGTVRNDTVPFLPGCFAIATLRDVKVVSHKIPDAHCASLPEKEVDMTIWEQIQKVLRSRKFWALLAALAAVAAGLSSGQIDTWQAVQAVIAALAVYSTGVAIEDAGIKAGSTEGNREPRQE